MKPVIGIIGGEGSMGRLFADFFRSQNLHVLISDKKTKLKNRELAKSADIVIVSVPIENTLKVINEISPHLRKNALLTDLTSLKEKQVKAMLKSHSEVLGMHPMFGSGNTLSGQTIIFCPTKKSGKRTAWLKNLFEKNNVKIETLTPHEHDQIMNVAQGLVHFVEITFADALRRLKMSPKKLLKYTGKASELKLMLAARLLAQDPNLYAHIQIDNPQALNSLKAYQQSIQTLIKIISKKDLKSFTRYFERSKKFLGSYANEAYDESSYLIDQLIIHRQTETSSKTSKPLNTALATLGPSGTYSDLAAEKYAPSLPRHYARDIAEIFALVASRRVKEGIVPAENKLHGTVRETLDSLFTHKVHIAASISLPINHCLATIPQSKKITKIISHNQALAQCKKHLDKQFPHAERIAISSTASAISRLNQTTAAILPLETAHHHNLKILAKNIADNPDNSTTFYVLKNGLYTPSTHVQKNSSKTSIIFYFSKDSPGSLSSVFQEFAAAKINLSRIESRPTKARFGEYIFYLDLDGTPRQPHVKKALASVTKKVAGLKILGVY